VLFEDIVSAVSVQGGFDSAAVDVSSTVVGSLVNEAYKEVVAETRWMMAVETLATTVAGTAAYDLPENVADVQAITIPNSTGDPGEWQPKTLTDLWGLKRGTLRLRGSGGVFAATAKADGTKQFELYPVPTQSGLVVTGLVALIPTDMVNGVSPAIPVDMHGKLVDAAIGLVMQRVENRPDLAAPFEQRKETLKALLMARKNSRMGSEPTRMMLEGYDF
jgi:hypothetical protein